MSIIVDLCGGFDPICPVIIFSFIILSDDHYCDFNDNGDTE